ncbi:hypothetical protein QK289_15585 [Exiguobacterium antarcticum]|uniref:Uncharacterized protein n=1 Tax=Exiguobacterium antarcticum TaxID=132920 RepID=A0ABT6R648_9BACL|nr:hypothetical protein [Exiguobacterium antarcticum]MDI3236437.1 hypothetical protein [Exiguobacterium antarcticum]
MMETLANFSIVKMWGYSLPPFAILFVIGFAFKIFWKMAISLLKMVLPLLLLTTFFYYVFS